MTNGIYVIYEPFDTYSYNVFIMSGGEKIDQFTTNDISVIKKAIENIGIYKVIIQTPYTIIEKFKKELNGISKLRIEENIK